MTTTTLLSLYTPSNHEPEVLEQLLVARHDLLSRIVAKVSSCAVSKARHHQLIVGPRGSGKTHLLSLIHHRLSTIDDRERIVLAWLREDSWGLDSYQKLIERTVDALGPRVSPAEPAIEQLKRLVGSRTLVIIVENLNDVFRRIKPEGQRALRSLVQEWDQIVLVAAAPSLFDGVSDHVEPFYGFFEINHLEELTLDEGAELLAKVAVLRGHPRMRQAVQSERGQQRLQVIRALAGGSPRIWMLFADCLDVENLDELIPQFLKALDDLMPYYQARMRDIEGQQENIVSTLCELRGAATVKDIAHRCEITSQSAASQLIKLQHKGYVRKVQLAPELGSADERESYFELREPLMRLCLEIKDRRAKPIKLIVDFLRHWFDPGVLLGSLDDSADAQTACQLAMGFDIARFAGFATETCATYRCADSLGQLGVGLVRTIPLFLRLNDDAAGAWISAWEAAAGQDDGMTVALRIMATAAAWRRDGKRTNLMRLPSEERELLIPLLLAAQTPLRRVRSGP